MKKLIFFLLPMIFPICCISQSISISGNQYHLYGPNSTWGAYLKVGGNGRNTSDASVVATNGNLHIDSKDDKALYLNHYSKTNTYINPQGGKVGIGTSSPLAQFQLNGNWDQLFRIGNKGSDDGGKFYSTYEAGSAFLNFIEYDDPFVFNFLQTRYNHQVKMGFHQGKVGIGTIYPDSKLTVKGQIHAQEVKVDLNGAVAPDYVFEKDYPLPSLDETEEFIQANKHLPDIPSAAEMEVHGIELKEMNLLLLKKMEELTLHTIRQEKTISQLQRQVENLTAQVSKLNKE